MAKHILKLEYDYDFILVGISCHLKDYRLSWAINKQLNIELVKSEKELEIFDRKEGKTERFSMLEYQDPETETQYILIANRCAEGYLVPEYRQADYFLIVREGFHLNEDELTERIREIDFVLTAFTVNIEGLKSKQNLLF